MDRASFELIGNVGKLEIKPLKDDRRLAIFSLATSERWKSADEWIEKTYWHRVVVFAPNKVALVEKAVQTGTRLRVAGQIRQNKWDDERGNTRYATELVVTGFGDVEILARGKSKADGEAAQPPAKAEKSRKKAA